jgi:PASTA domain-containing protein
MHILRPGVVAVACAAVLAGCGSSGEPASPSAASPPAARALVIVPQLIGRRQEDAHRLAARSGLTVRWAGFAGRLANGHYVVRCVKVLRQSPAAGERRPRGAAISIIEVACTVPQGWAHVAH